MRGRLFPSVFNLKCFKKLPTLWYVCTKASINHVSEEKLKKIDQSQIRFRVSELVMKFLALTPRTFLVNPSRMQWNS